MFQKSIIRNLFEISHSKFKIITRHGYFYHALYVAIEFGLYLTSTTLGNTKSGAGLSVESLRESVFSTDLPC